MPIPLPLTVRRILRPLYFRVIFLRQRLRVRRLWQQSRRSQPPTFFPAIKAYDLSTRAYVQSRRSANPESTFIPIPDSSYFAPAHPKTIGDNPLAHQIIPTNPPLFVAKLPSPCIYADAGDVISNDNILLPDISFRHVVNLWQERGEHLALEKNPLPPAQPMRGEYALLASRYGGANYFHWLYNVLSRVALLERAGIPRDGLTFLINRLTLPVMGESLEFLGISPDQLVEMDNSTAIQPESVWVMPCFLRTGHRRRWILEWLRAHFLRDTPRGKPTRRLYLSRADAAYRRVVNEDEIMHLLGPLGFEKIATGTLSIFEQSARFAHAEIVIGPHGAGMANLVFCAPGTRVIEFMSADRLRTYMYELSAARGLDYYYGLLQRDITNPRSKEMEQAVIPFDHLQSALRYAKIS